MFHLLHLVFGSSFLKSSLSAPELIAAAGAQDEGQPPSNAASNRSSLRQPRRLQGRASIIQGRGRSHSRRGMHALSVFRVEYSARSTQKREQRHIAERVDAQRESSLPTLSRVGQKSLRRHSLSSVASLHVWGVTPVNTRTFHRNIECEHCRFL